MSSHVPFGDPDNILCRWCKAVRVLFRRNGHVTRLCRTCDAPEHRAPTWAPGVAE